MSRALTFGQQGQRPGQGDEVAGRGAAGADPRGQPLQVVRLAEHRPQVAAEDRTGRAARRRRRAARRSRSGAVSGEVSQSASSRAPIGVTVRSMTLRSEPSRLPSRSVRTSSRLRRVISSRASVSAATVRGQPGDVGQRGLLGLAEVGHQGAGGLDLGGPVVDAEAGQGRGAELVEERLAGLLGLEVPRGPDRDRADRLAAEQPDPGGVEAQLGDQDLGRVEPGDLVDQLGPQQPGQREPAGGELDPGQAELAADLDDRRQVVGRPGVEQLVVGQRARA